MQSLEPANIEFLNSLVSGVRIMTTLAGWLVLLGCALLAGWFGWMYAVDRWSALRTWWNRSLQAQRRDGW